MGTGRRPAGPHPLWPRTDSMSTWAARARSPLLHSCYPVAMSDRSLAVGNDTRGRRRVVTSGHARHRHHLLGHPVAELLPFAQRHDAVAGARALSHPQELLRPELQPGRPDHPGLPVHGLHAATRGRPLHRPPPATVFPDGRHRPHPDRPPADVPSLDVSRDPARRHVDRDGLVDLPSRSLPRGAHGGRRTLWARPVPVPGRRERRLGLRPLARRIRRRPARAVEHCVVLGCGADRDRRAAAGRWLVRAQPPARATGPAHPGRRRGVRHGATPEHAAAPEGHPGRGHPRGPALLQERLQRQPRLVLHLLSDRQVPPAGPDGAVLSVRLPRRHRGRHACRRSGR